MRHTAHTAPTLLTLQPSASQIFLLLPLLACQWLLLQAQMNGAQDPKIAPIAGTTAAMATTSSTNTYKHDDDGDDSSGSRNPV